MTIALKHRIVGRKGKSSPAPPRLPVEAENTLRAKATGIVADLLSEGPIVGLVDGAKSIYFNDVPLQNPDGSWNFKGALVGVMQGLPDQAAATGWASGASTPISVASPGGPGYITNASGGFTFTVGTGTYTDLRITLLFPYMAVRDLTSGDVNPTGVTVRIEYKPFGGSYSTVFEDTVYGKCVSTYEKAYRFPLAGAGPWTVRVTRLSSDTHLDNPRTTYNSFTVGAVSALTDWPLIYPDSAYAMVKIDAEAFGGQMPVRTYDIKGRIIQIPSNYDPVTRLYSGIWNGTFVSAWSDNPAWVYYDMVTHTRYGLGNDIPPAAVDKWALYTIGQYSDGWNARPGNPSNDYSSSGKHGIPNGRGGFEPRFTFNGVINSSQDAFTLLQMIAAGFRGMAYYGAGVITATQDRPDQAVKLVTNANVHGGSFRREGSAFRARHTVANVVFNDPDNAYEPTIEPVDDPIALSRWGVRSSDIAALGCTNRTQARRIGRWLLDAEQSETEVISYRGGLDQSDLRPGDLIQIADRWYGGTRFGGRMRPYDAYCMGPYGQNLVKTPVFGGASPAEWAFVAAGTAVPDVVEVDKKRWSYEMRGFEGYSYQGLPSSDAGRRTNFIRNPRFYSSTTGGTPSGALPLYWSDFFTTTTGVTATPSYGTEDGMEYLDITLSGTASATGIYHLRFDVANTTAVVSAETGQTWTVSAHAKRAGGSSAGMTNARWHVFFNAPNGVAGVQNIQGSDKFASIGSGSLAAQRISQTFLATTAGIGTVRTEFRISIQGGSAINYTIRFARPQLELASAATAVMVPPVNTARISSVSGATFSGFEAIEGEVLNLGGWIDGTNASAASTFGIAWMGHTGNILSTSALSTVSAGTGLTYRSGTATTPNWAVRGVLFVRHAVTDGTATPGGAHGRFVALWASRSPIAPYSNMGLNTIYRLDSPTTLSVGTNFIRVHLWDGTMEEREIVSAVGSTDLITVTSAFSKYPLVDAVWLMSSGTVAPQLFRVIAVSEVNVGTFEVVGLFHDPTKFDRVEFDINSPPPSYTAIPTGPVAAPQSISHSEYLYFYAGSAHAACTLSWASPSDPRVTGAQIEMMRPGATGFERCGDTPSLSFDVPDTSLGDYTFRIRHYDALGRYSRWTTYGPVGLSALLQPPQNVTGFTGHVRGDGFFLEWQPVREHLISYYKIKYNANPGATDWESAVTIAERVDGLQFEAPLRDGAYFIKAVTLAGIESPVAGLVVCSVAWLIKLNAIEQIDQQPSWSGTKTDTAINGSTLELASGHLTGTYTWQSSDLGDAHTSRLTPYINAAGVLPGDYMSNWGTLEGVSFLSTAVSSQWSVNLEYRTTQVDPALNTWSDWVPLDVSDVVARAFQFRATLTSFDGIAMPQIAELSISIDMPDRVEGDNSVSIPSGGSTITFNEKFANIPAVAVTASNLATGDYWVINTVTNSSFFIQFKTAGGTGVARSCDWIAKGYGRA